MSTTNTSGAITGAASTSTESGGSAKAAARKKRNNSKKNNKNKTTKGRKSFNGSQPEGSVLYKYVIEDNSNQATQLRDLIEILPVFTTIYPLWPSSIRNMERLDPTTYLTQRPDAVSEGYAKLIDILGADGKPNGGKEVIYIDPIKHECAMDHWKLKVKTETDTMEKYKLNGSNLFEIIRGQLDDPVLGKLAHDPDYQKALISQCPIELLTLLKSACSLGDGSTVNPKLARLQLFRKSVSFQQKPRHKNVAMETSKYKRTFEVHIDSVMEKSGLFAFGTSWWDPYLKADGKTLLGFMTMSTTDQNKYNAQVKDEIIGMLMIEGCDSEGLKNHLKNEYKINGKIDCYPTTSSKAADLIDSYIEVGGSNSSKSQRTTTNDNEDEQIAGIHTTESSDEALDNDTPPIEELPEELMNAALAAVQDGGEEDPNYYLPLEVDDIDFDEEQVAGIHLVIEDNDDPTDESSSSSSSYHLSDHYYCPSDDNEYPSSSDDESSLDSNMPGLQSREAECSSSDDEGSTGSVEDDNDGDSVSIQGSVNDGCNDNSTSNDDTLSIPTAQSVHDAHEVQIDYLNVQSSSGFTHDAFDHSNTIPSPITTSSNDIPPVSSIIIMNGQNDVNSSVATRVNERIDPVGRVPIRIQQDCFAHVDDLVCNTPTLVDIAGTPTKSWTTFVETRRSFPTQVVKNNRVLLDNGASMAIAIDLPNFFLHYRPKRAGVIRSRIDPPDFYQGGN
jgi:hypothetical protein